MLLPRDDVDGGANEIGFGRSFMTLLPAAALLPAGATLFGCDNARMRSISQRELRDDTGAIMRALDAGERFVVTRNGRPIAQLLPLRRRTPSMTPQDLVAAACATGSISRAEFFRDLDEVVDQSVEPV